MMRIDWHLEEGQRLCAEALCTLLSPSARGPEQGSQSKLGGLGEGGGFRGGRDSIPGRGSGLHHAGGNRNSMRGSSYGAGWDLGILSWGMPGCESWLLIPASGKDTHMGNSSVGSSS